MFQITTNTTPLAGLVPLRPSVGVTVEYLSAVQASKLTHNPRASKNVLLAGRKYTAGPMCKAAEGSAQIDSKCFTDRIDFRDLHMTRVGRALQNCSCLSVYTLQFRD